jgi:dipeptidyl aminopeptidase/acylaminoacyl peptidase
MGVFMASKRMAVTSLRRFRMVSDPQISPDGRRIAFVHTTVDHRVNDYVSNIWLADCKSGESIQFTSGRVKDRCPRWSPDGLRLLFTSTPPNKGADDEKKAQLFVIRLAGGEAAQLTDVEGGIRNPLWSPHGRRILFTSLVPEGKKPKADVKVVTRLMYRFNAKGFFNGRRSHIFTISAKGGRPKQVTRGAYDVDAAEWLVQDQRIAFISNLNADADLTRDKYIYSVSVNGDAPAPLTDGHRTITSLKPSPQGGELAYIGHDYRRGLATNQDLWIVPATGGASENLTRGFDQSIGTSLSCDVRVTTPNQNPQWSTDGEALYFTSANGGVVGLYRVPRRGGDVEKVLGDIDHSVEAWSLSRDGSIAYTVLQTTAPIELWMKTGGAKRALTAFNRRWIRRLEVCGSERFSFTSSAGHTVEGWLMKPPEFEEGIKYPLLLEIHGGPRGVYGFSFMHEFQVLAAQGWVVLYTNPYGSGGYEEAFQAGLPGHYGEQDYGDLMEAVDHVLQHYDFIDAQRLGVLGGSYGGFMTNWIVTHTDRFKAAVTMRSISNWMSMFGCSDIGWTFGKWEMGGSVPWSDEEAYMAKSPIRYVESVKTPTLIIHSEEDYRCPMEQAEQFYTALKFLGVPTELVRFPGEHHGLSREGKPKHREERLNHIIRWFKTYL